MGPAVEFAFMCAIVAAATLGTSLLVHRLTRGGGARNAAADLTTARWIAAALPWSWLLAFSALVLRARLVLGFWPYPRHPGPSGGFLDYVDSPLDPKCLGLHTDLLWLTMIVPLIALPVLGLVLLLERLVSRERRRDPSRFAPWATLAGTTAWAVLVFVDPGGFFDWFVD